MVQAQVVRMKPAQTGGGGRGQAAGGHFERVTGAAAAAASAGDAARGPSGPGTAGRGALQVRLGEQRARMVGGQGQLGVEQQVGGGAERGRAQRTGQARPGRVHGRVQVRQQVWRRRDGRSERHVGRRVIAVWAAVSAAGSWNTRPKKPIKPTVKNIIRCSADVCLCYEIGAGVRCETGWRGTN